VKRPLCLARAARPRAFPFALAGRTFREWAAISPSASETWAGLLEEAQTFDGSTDASRPKR
jgi:hypothetical protein